MVRYLQLAMGALLLSLAAASTYAVCSQDELAESSAYVLHW